MNATATLRAHVLSNLDSRATTESATAPTEQALRTGPAITGQYLYDRFIANNDASQTLANIVRTAASDTGVAIGVWKKALTDMVDQAKQADGGKAGAKTKTARNYQSLLRVTFGAMRFAQSELAEQGYNERTGLEEMRVMAKAALTQRGMTWEGIQALSPADKQRHKQQKAEQSALADIQKVNPRNIDESMQDYQARTIALVEPYMQQLREAEKDERINALAMRVINLCGDDIDDVVKLIQDEGVIWPEEKQAGDGAPQAE